MCIRIYWIFFLELKIYTKIHDKLGVVIMQVFYQVGLFFFELVGMLYLSRFCYFFFFALISPKNVFLSSIIALAELK